MTFNMNTMITARPHAIAVPLTIMTEFFAKFRSASRSFFKALQDARMVSTLTQMSDTQLKQIGISRSEIPEFARKLMAGEDTDTNP